jgi:ribonuclease HI
VIFENTPSSIKSVCFRILGDLEIPRDRRIHTPRFIQPTLHLGWNIAWFDGTSQNVGLHCGAGGLIKRLDHTKITWTFNCGAGSNTKAELLGVWATLLLATRHNILELQVMGDSKIIIDWLNNKGKLQVIALECWKDRITDLIKAFTQISFSHVYRETNEEVDTLSKNALTRLTGVLTYQLWTDGQEGPPQCITLF